MAGISHHNHPGLDEKVIAFQAVTLTIWPKKEEEEAGGVSRKLEISELITSCPDPNA